MAIISGYVDNLNTLFRIDSDSSSIIEVGAKVSARILTNTFLGVVASIETVAKAILTALALVLYPVTPAPYQALLESTKLSSAIVVKTFEGILGNLSPSIKTETIEEKKSPEIEGSIAPEQVQEEVQTEELKTHEEKRKSFWNFPVIQISTPQVPETMVPIICQLYVAALMIREPDLLLVLAGAATIALMLRNPSSPLQVFSASKNYIEEALSGEEKKSDPLFSLFCLAPFIFGAAASAEILFRAPRIIGFCNHLIGKINQWPIQAAITKKAIDITAILKSYVPEKPLEIPQRIWQSIVQEKVFSEMPKKVTEPPKVLKEFAQESIFTQIPKKLMEIPKVLKSIVQEKVFKEIPKKVTEAPKVLKPIVQKKVFSETPSGLFQFPPLQETAGGSFLQPKFAIYLGVAILVSYVSYRYLWPTLRSRLQNANVPMPQAPGPAAVPRQAPVNVVDEFEIEDYNGKKFKEFCPEPIADPEAYDLPEEIPLEFEEDPTYPQFECAISHQLIRHPVLDPNRKALYEFRNIVQWLADHNTSPANRAPLRVDDLIQVPHISRYIKMRLHEHVQKNKKNEDQSHHLL
jgi:hypothetical protein